MFLNFGWLIILGIYFIVYYVSASSRTKSLQSFSSFSKHGSSLKSESSMNKECLNRSFGLIDKEMLSLYC